MVNLLNNYNQDSPTAALALKTFFIIPKLFFQKTHRKAKTSDHTKALARRVVLWQNNKLNELLDEARSIQGRLVQHRRNKKHNVDKARNFANQIRQGKVSPALRALEDEHTGGVLPLCKGDN